MMKQLTIILLLILPMMPVLQAQDSLLYGIFRAQSRRIVYEKNIDVDSTNKDNLFNRTKDWALAVYKVPKDSGQVEDKQKGVLTYKGSFTVMFSDPKTRVASEWICGQTFRITCTDNMATILVTDLEQRTPSGYGSINIVKLEDMKKRTDSLPRSAFFGKNNKSRYWQAELVALKEIDNKVKGLIASLEKTLRSNKTD